MLRLSLRMTRGRSRSGRRLPAAAPESAAAAAEGDKGSAEEIPPGGQGAEVGVIPLGRRLSGCQRRRALGGWGWRASTRVSGATL